MATKALGHPFTINNLYKLLLANSGWIMVEFYDVSQTLYKARPRVTWFLVPEKNVYPATGCKKSIENLAKICENPHKIRVSWNSCDSIQNRVSARLSLLNAAYLKAFFYHYHSILGSAFVGFFSTVIQCAALLNHRWVCCLWRNLKKKILQKFFRGPASTK